MDETLFEAENSFDPVIKTRTKPVWTEPLGGIIFEGTALPFVIGRRLKILILVYLWAALVEDTLLFLMAWLAPDLWFQVFHHSSPAGLEIAFLRRSAGQWAAFSVVQAITLWRWQRNPVWLAVEAGVRFSDLFTDISYVVAAPSLTALGWILLLPPAALNLIGVVIMLRGYEQAQTRAGSASASSL